MLAYRRYPNFIGTALVVPVIALGGAPLAGAEPAAGSGQRADERSRPSAPRGTPWRSIGLAGPALCRWTDAGSIRSIIRTGVYRPCRRRP